MDYELEQLVEKLNESIKIQEEMLKEMQDMKTFMHVLVNKIGGLL